MKRTLISLFMLILVISLAAISQSVNFDDTSDLSTYFNNSYADVTNSTIGGINNTGALQFPFLSNPESRTVTFKDGFTINQLDQPITISAYIHSLQNGGFAGLGISSLPTNSSSSICQITNTPALGMEFYSSAAQLFSNLQQYQFNYSPDIPLTWYKVDLTITPRADDVYDLNYKLYRTDSIGSFHILTKQGSKSFTNTTIGSVDGKVYPYLTACWHRVPYMDNFYFEAPDAPPTPSIVPTVISDPIVASVLSELDAAISNPIIGLYACTFSGTSDLDIPITADQRAFAYYNNGTTLGWHEGDYDLNPGFAKWLNVPFGAKGSIPVVIIDPVDTLPVTLSSFTATVSSGTLINLQWTTESESNLLGFNVYRSEDEELLHAVKMNANYIESSNSSTFHTYNFPDNDFDPSTYYYYWIESVEMNSTSSFYGPVSVFSGEPGEDVPEYPTESMTGIESVYPNPFSPNTQIAYRLNSATDVRICIYNHRGQLIRTLLNSAKDSGQYQISWDGNDNNGIPCATGMYIARMQAGEVNSSYKMLLVK